MANLRSIDDENRRHLCRRKGINFLARSMERDQRKARDRTTELLRAAEGVTE